jgi:glycosyltransferase involved in cell wall biosynthesis
MIRVAFVVPPHYQNWMGGINYYRNLLHAIQRTPDKRIEAVLFTGNKIGTPLLNSFPPVDLVQTALLDQFSLAWTSRMVIRETMSTDFFMEREFNKNAISVVSHYAGDLGTKTNMRVLGWIPDFQHMHYPEYFTEKELRSRNKTFLNICALSSHVLLSSNSAYEDFIAFAPAFSHKARILHFVSQPNMPAQDLALTKDLKAKYDTYSKYFFLPNQFWKHKNHKVVFDAVKLLKDRGCNITVLCSGSTHDYRNKIHIQDLLEFIRANNLGENIHILGMINSIDLFYLMRNSVSVLNPSLFEGWSTTVEEAKSLGKNMTLSDIPVHREQDPPESDYFDPLNAAELAEVLWRKYNQHDGGPDFSLEAKAKETLTERTIRFAETYQRIILESFTIS